ncbi:MAG: YbhB/YbcL family Raf kinase inhibitor-like protein [Candidatus Binatia bacterium]
MTVQMWQVTLACAALFPAAAGAFTLTSKVFEPNGPIPAKYTCEGADVAPPLKWDAPPADTKSFVLIADDPDAPDPLRPRKTPWVHWVIYNIPASARELPEGGALPDGAQAGVNELGNPVYDGPCPPTGKHRYSFKLYALGAPLPDLGAASKGTVEEFMRSHVLQTTELIGTYEKQR